MPGFWSLLSSVDPALPCSVPASQPQIHSSPPQGPSLKTEHSSASPSTRRRRTIPPGSGPDSVSSLFPNSSTEQGNGVVPAKMGGRNGNLKKANLYSILGVSKDCSVSELRDAYKKLALRWHPDRCLAAGHSKLVEESKKMFQAIQHTYSVLSDENKRFMYDVGAYEEDDQNGMMGDFLNEMAVMMSQTKACEVGDEGLEELRDLLDEMFQGDIDAFSSYPYRSLDQGMCSSFSSSSSSSSSYNSYRPSTRSLSEMSRGTGAAHGSSGFDCRFQNFCFGTDRVGEMPHHERKGSQRKNGWNQQP